MTENWKDMYCCEECVENAVLMKNNMNQKCHKRKSIIQDLVVVEEDNQLLEAGENQFWKYFITINFWTTFYYPWYPKL